APVTLRAETQPALVTRDHLPAAVPIEHEVGEGPRCQFLVFEVEVAVPLRAPALGRDTNNPASLRRRDPSVVLVTLLPTPPLRLNFRPYVPRAHPDRSSLALILGPPQDPFELKVDLPAEFGCGVLGEVGEVDGGVRGGILPDLGQAIDQHPNGLAVL